MNLVTKRILLAVVWLCYVTGLFCMNAEADVFTNTAEQSVLPQGLGLAARFKADSGITAHSSVIFADDFESGELGARWDEQSPAKNHALSFAIKKTFMLATASLQ